MMTWLCCVESPPLRCAAVEGDVRDCERPRNVTGGKVPRFVHRQRVVDNRDGPGNTDISPLEALVTKPAVVELRVTEDSAVVRRIQEHGVRWVGCRSWVARICFGYFGLRLSGRGEGRLNRREGRVRWDLERKPDVGEGDRAGGGADARDQDDVVDDDQAAGVLDPIPLQENVGSTCGGELLVNHQAVVGRIEHARVGDERGATGGRQRTGRDHCVMEHFEVSGDTLRDRRTVRDVRDRDASQLRAFRMYRERVVHELHVAADMHVLPLEALIAESASIELPAPDEPAVGGRIDEGVISEIIDLSGHGPRAAERDRKERAERPGGRRQFLRDGIAVTGDDRRVRWKFVIGCSSRPRRRCRSVGKLDPLHGDQSLTAVHGLHSQRVVDGRNASDDVDLLPLEADVAESAVVELRSNQLPAVSRRICVVRVEGWVLNDRAGTDADGCASTFFGLRGSDRMRSRAV